MGLQKRGGELQALRIKEAINRGSDIDLYKTHIKGNLKLSETEDTKQTSLSDAISSEVQNHKKHRMRFGHCFFEGIVDFSEPISWRDHAIEKKTIASELDFTNSIFEDAVTFSNVVFKENVKFDKAIFKNNVYFFGAVFCRGASFRNANFEKIASFQQAQFCCDAVFENVEFAKCALFDGDDDKETKFHRANFNYAQFNNNAFFNKTQFVSQASFIETTFSKTISFNGAKFESEACFFGTKFNGSSFLNAKNYDGILDLRYSVIHSMDLSKAGFNNRICFENSEIIKLKVPWKSIKGKIIFMEEKAPYDASYLALVKNYNNMGWFDDADSCYWIYRIERSKTLNMRDAVVPKTLDIISFFLYGHGVKIFCPIISIAVIIILSALFFLSQNQTHDIWDAVDVSISNFFIYPDTDLTGLCRNLSKIERIAGLFLVTILIVILGKKTIRQ
jgi:uncharacterized protein YjbI with pentapeptide repeats